MTVYKLDDAIKHAKAILPHMGTDQTLPVLTNVIVRPESDTTVTWSATDRYTLARGRLETLGDPDPEPYLLPLNALKYLAALKVNALRYGGVRPLRELYRADIRNEDGTTTVRLFVDTGDSVPEDRSMTFDAPQDTTGYPPTDKLWRDISDTSGDDIRLAPDKMERAVKSARAFAVPKSDENKLTFRPRGSKALYAVVGGEQPPKFEMLIMPMSR